MHYHEFRAMNTQILLAADGPFEAVETGFQEAQALIEGAERRFTRFSEHSELSALNASSGGWFEASPDLYALVTLAADLYQRTRGLFDPGVLEALEKVGYDRSMDELRRYGAPVMAAVLARPRTARFGFLSLDPHRRRIKLPEGMRIDLGGIAKGWIAGKAAAALSRWSKSCAVDAGGDTALIGVPNGDQSWRVALEDPRNPARTLAVLKLPPGAVATSALTKRRWQQNGQERHHLIDPRTQRPAVSDWLSVTVIGQSPAEAEVYAKAILIGGMREANRLTNREEGIEYIAVDQRGKLWGSKRSKEYIDVRR
jgi:thiamine biosynthesis lipoprotein